ncbi:FMN-dependent NADH-azoreductase [Dyadobacter sp. SG02]|uniref:FMN-dependent NADH-azoreductase n=1 Tax=Dyadobacter sp. SG02 TaxID=1855291 RepID=UPI0008B6714D|nr:NAD(P)H-dependent oxidoreductase [Dyadobacter sp. SG02]SEI54839.1 FMN-dependent NADH-azoreductase [Dyadobacter sp. SG02]
MKKALHITSSARGGQSYSRALSAAIVRKLTDRKEIGTVVERDLIQSPPPYLNEELIGEFYKHADSATEEGKHLLRYSNAIFSEMDEADIIVISTPMHNLGVSAPLKAWLDQLVRVGLTYRFNEDGSRAGCLKNKKVYLAIASGGKQAFWPEGYEFIESYIKAVFGTYIGITDVATYRVEGTAMGVVEVDYDEILADL